MMGSRHLIKQIWLIPHQDNDAESTINWIWNGNQSNEYQPLLFKVWLVDN